MTPELSPDISNHIYYDLVHRIHPDNIHKISPSDLNKDLRFLTISQPNLSLRKIVFENSLAAILLESSQRLIQSDTQNPSTVTIAHKLLPIIMLNQINQRFEPVWKTMINQQNQLSSPLENILLSLGNRNTGIRAVALLPNKNQDFTKPPIHKTSQAFSEWIRSIHPDDSNYEISKFLGWYSDFYSPSDQKALIEKISLQSLPKKIKSYFNHFQQNNLI